MSYQSWPVFTGKPFLPNDSRKASFIPFDGDVVG